MTPKEMIEKLQLCKQTSEIVFAVYVDNMATAITRKVSSVGDDRVYKTDEPIVMIELEA